MNPVYKYPQETWQIQRIYCEICYIVWWFDQWDLSNNEWNSKAQRFYWHIGYCWYCDRALLVWMEHVGTGPRIWLAKFRNLSCKICNSLSIWKLILVLLMCCLFAMLTPATFSQTLQHKQQSNSAIWHCLPDHKFLRHERLSKLSKYAS